MGVRKRIFTLSAAIGAGIVTIAIGLILWSTTLSPASQAQTVGVEPAPIPLEQAASQAEDLSQDVYGGLDTTKKIIGKTEPRNQAIERGRDAASQKMEELSDRARQAEASGDDVLSATDKRVLKHISE
ncbi:hypothetical protein PGN35_018635 [Nodosilinea sp. PGN35]|uniref:hypothetical protein n=1 Tax=Nodosilinea sp. PGN35 TaxID=3020489 RepID=UPI0023B3337A|nr:hypothetical protein [Nodosilinea sp. TSF1-S3]MDF0368222.1 hypothetical protein [Nodosilinea sp. TSF1-S3]